MKRISTYLILILSAVILSSCYEGYTGPEGETLKKYLEPEDLKQLTEKPDPQIRIIDVRPASAYKKGHIPTALSFPSSEIMDRLAELPADAYYIIYCETGGRAQAVIKKLIPAGYTRVMNWGGYKRWKWDFAGVPD